MGASRFKRRLIGFAAVLALVTALTGTSAAIAINTESSAVSPPVTTAQSVPGATLPNVQLSSYVFHIPRWHAYVIALEQIGKPYVWGAAGPNAFDCSGLVYYAYKMAGVPYFGRDTMEMLASPRLQRIPASEARFGDLVFFGTGHVELYVFPHWTLGALQSGTPVGFHRWYSGSWWHPTAYYHVIGTR